MNYTINSDKAGMTQVRRRWGGSGNRVSIDAPTSLPFLAGVGANVTD